MYACINQIGKSILTGLKLLKEKGNVKTGRLGLYGFRIKVYQLTYHVFKRLCSGHRFSENTLSLLSFSFFLCDECVGLSDYCGCLRFS